MPTKIAIFYHCLFQLNDELLPAALEIIPEQMWALKSSGLEDEASEIVIGINGGDEASAFSEFFPAKSTIVYHGLQCRNECRTILILQEWAKAHPGWYVLYFHSKGACHPIGDYMRTRWRKCMQRTVVENWRKCLADLDSGYEAVGNHWMQPPATPPGQYIFAGTFFWIKTDFLNTLPSIMERARIKESGIDSFESRYEAEVFLGNGPRPPRIKDYHPNWNPGKVSTCQP